MQWSEFIVAFVFFLVSHAVPVRPAVKTWLVARIGSGGFTLAYSMLSLAALAWLIIAASRAPYVMLWMWAPWQNHLALFLMLLVCLIVAQAIARPNPFSFGGRHNDSFDPGNPGIVRLTRHPMLVALALWSMAHLVPNGDLAHGLLFLVFAIFSLLGFRIIDRRKQREMPQWHRLQRDVRQLPLSAVALPVRVFVTRLLAGLVLFVVLVVAHPTVIGVDPLSALGGLK